MWTHSSVTSVTSPVVGGDARGMAAIDTGAVALPPMPGEVLVDSAGQVVGILDASAREPQGRDDVFLPAELVVGVAHRLAGGDQVGHGWLDVMADDAPAGSLPRAHGQDVAGAGGAQVTRVEAGGAASGVLQAGDVVLAVDGRPVRSVGELRARIYVLDPGSPVHLEIYRNGAERSVEVTLSASP